MSEEIPSISLEALVAATTKNQNNTATNESAPVNVDALYNLAQKYFEEHPDTPIVDKSKNGIINAYLQAQALNQNKQSNQQAMPEAQPQAAAPQQQNQSGDLFGTLFDAFLRAAIHEAMHHHCHCACPHGHFSHLSFGLPPYMAGCHDRFCHRVDAREAHNRVKTMTGSFEIGEGISDVIKGNTASGITGALGGGFKIASVILDKQRGR
ncbi:MAG: hypothetical protein J6C85_07645 [Alphaproteobacteria bacterium]|nr:hypothetical protein [Alphaproteobacteria bacterium]MBP3515462.1 hypothetical protein [Alphaproteobacteria bacterium]